MQLIRRKPISDMMSFDTHLDRFFNDFFTPVRWRAHKDERFWNPAADIIENDDAFMINVELPGLGKDQINVDVKEKILTINGERSEEKEEKTDKVYRRERFQGKFQRAFALPDSVDTGKIEAEFSDGLLKITIPKVPKEKPKQITVH